MIMVAVMSIKLKIPQTLWFGFENRNCALTLWRLDFEWATDKKSCKGWPAMAMILVMMIFDEYGDDDDGGDDYWWAQLFTGDW